MPIKFPETSSDDATIELVFSSDTIEEDKDEDNNLNHYNITLRQILCPSPQALQLAATTSRSSFEYEDNEESLENLECGQTIQSSEFILQSPKYPRNYQDNLDCYIRVLPFNANICSLELRFDEFRLAESSIDQGLNCPNDYLEISNIDGNDGSSSQTKSQKYCDVFAGIRLIEMGSSGKQFHFHTDNDANDVGYSIVVRQLACDLETSTTTESIFEEEQEGRTSSTTTTTTTPSYDQSSCQHYNPFTTTTSLPMPLFSTPAAPIICSERYSLNSQQPIFISNLGFPQSFGTRCLYTIETSPDTCSVQVDFKQFNVGTFANEVGCLNDYLLINENTKVCGFHSGTEIYPTYGSGFSMELVSSIGSGPGYEIVIKPIYCSKDNIDSYGAPLADPIIPSYSVTDQLDSYGVPQAPPLEQPWTPIYYHDNDDQSNPPIIHTSRPTYGTTIKPSYHPRPRPWTKHRSFNWLSPLRSIIRAKHRALKSLFGSFAHLTLPRPPRPSRPSKPKYRPSKPLYYPQL